MILANEQGRTTNKYTNTVLTHERCNLCGVRTTCVFMQVVVHLFVVLDFVSEMKGLKLKLKLYLRSILYDVTHIPLVYIRSKLIF